MKAGERALRSAWAAIKSTAKFDPQAGLCKAWAEHVLEWGPPLEVAEQDVDVDGTKKKGRTFLKVGMVVWNPESGAEVVGWGPLE